MVSIPFGKNRRIGDGEDLFFIAEIGINHNQDLDLARRLIDAAAQAGCDAAKFQTFKAKDLYVQNGLAGSYHLMGRDIPIFELHTKLEMPVEWIPVLQAHCASRHVEFFSTPVSTEAVDLLDQAGVPGFKISSYDFTNLPLIRYTGSKRKPIIISNGGGTLGETEEAVTTAQQAGAPVALMHCVAQYPAPYHCANLAIIETLKRCFEIPVGFSDNGFVDDQNRIDSDRVPLAAASAGADLFEIHITLDRSLSGPDHGFAINPAELHEMVKRMREARADYVAGKRPRIDPVLMGTGVKRTLPEERYVRNFAYKCLFVNRKVKKGERLDANTVVVLRPGQHARGIDPKYFDVITERAHAACDLNAWDPVTWASVLA